MEHGVVLEYLNILLANTGITVTEAHLITSVIVIVVLWLALKNIRKLFAVKGEYDSYIDNRIDRKIESLKEEMCKVQTQQAITCEDVQQIKTQLSEMNVHLKFMGENFCEFKELLMKVLTK